MKKMVSVLLTISLLITVMSLSACAAETTENKTILLQVGNTQMLVNSQPQTLDSEPVVVNGRTLVPIRAIIEAMGGTVSWEQSTSTAVLTYGSDEIRLTINSLTAYVNNEEYQLDTAPAVINNRTMLPIRFIAENFNFNVEWNDDTQEITITENMSGEIPVEELSNTNNPEVNNMSNQLKIKIGNRTLTATLAENSSVDALKEMLAKGDITIDMSDYANFEKVGSLGASLPRNDEQITTEAGDLILYQGNNIVIYYDTNSWNFTRLGKINDITQAELKEILGKGNVTVTFSMN